MKFSENVEMQEVEKDATATEPTERMTETREKPSMVLMTRMSNELLNADRVSRKS